MIEPPFNLKCEYGVNPICIDIRNPRFTWILAHNERIQAQTAFQIIISSNKSLSRRIEADLWDSGKLISGNS